MHAHRLSHWVGIVAIAALLGCEMEEAPEVEPATEVAAPTPGYTPPVTTPTTRVTLDVATTPEFGPHLTDASGRALYLLEADSAGSSTCYDACAEAWPPFLAPEGTPEAADAAVQSGMIGTLTRRDGTVQVTYNDHPLYHYSRDPGPGQVSGQDVTDEWGEWYLVTPEGQELEDN